MKNNATIRAIVTDIEGTTSSIAFVKDTLFPYARAQLDSYVRAHENELGDILTAVCAEAHDPALSLDGIIHLLRHWIDTDQKITPLKYLQGMMWRQGYDSGALQAHVYPDAVRGLQRWHQQGVRLFIYSSGSIAAQKLLFAHTPVGDLNGLFTGYFDTTTGSKLASTSYQTIAQHINLPAAEILFLSDAPAELIAAQQAGMRVIMLTRDGASADPTFESTSSFDTILKLERAA